MICSRRNRRKKVDVPCENAPRSGACRTVSLGIFYRDAHEFDLGGLQEHEHGDAVVKHLDHVTFQEDTGFSCGLAPHGQCEEREAEEGQAQGKKWGKL